MRPATPLMRYSPSRNVLPSTSKKRTTVRRGRRGSRRRRGVGRRRGSSWLALERLDVLDGACRASSPRRRAGARRRRRTPPGCVLSATSRPTSCAEGHHRDDEPAVGTGEPRHPQLPARPHAAGVDELLDGSSASTWPSAAGCRSAPARSGRRRRRSAPHRRPPRRRRCRRRTRGCRSCRGGGPPRRAAAGGRDGTRAAGSSPSSVVSSSTSRSQQRPIRPASSASAVSAGRRLRCRAPRSGDVAGRVRLDLLDVDDTEDRRRPQPEHVLHALHLGDRRRRRGAAARTRGRAARCARRRATGGTRRTSSGR